MHCAIIEFAKNVLGWKQADSTEHNPQTPYPVITLMDQQLHLVNKGGTTHLGAQKCQITPGTKAAKSYSNAIVVERHRHRYTCHKNISQI